MKHTQFAIPTNSKFAIPTNSKFVIPTIGGILIIIATNGCMTYQRAQRRYATVATDTAIVTKQVTLTIPRDSAVLRLITDTTHVVSEARQGRATVRIVREPHYTTIYAECDSATVTKNIVAKIPQQKITWGVNKWYKRGFYALLLLLLAIAAVARLSKIFEVRVTRKTP